jgi:hypothetical protein
MASPVQCERALCETNHWRASTAAPARLMVPPTIRYDTSIELGGAAASSAAGSIGSGVPTGSSLCSPIGDGVVPGVEPEALEVGDRLGVAVGPSSGLGGGVGRGRGRGGSGELVGAGGSVGRGVGAAVGGGGGGVGVGAGGPVTVTIGPRSGSGCGSVAVVAWNVTCQLPAGSVDVACQVPSIAVSLTLVRATVTLPTCAWTALAGCSGRSLEMYSTLKVKVVAVVPLVGETLPSVSSDAARTGVGAVANESASSAAATARSVRRTRGVRPESCMW